MHSGDAKHRKYPWDLRQCINVSILESKTFHSCQNQNKLPMRGRSIHLWLSCPPVTTQVGRDEGFSHFMGVTRTRGLRAPCVLEVEASRGGRLASGVNRRNAAKGRRPTNGRTRRRLARSERKTKKKRTVDVLYGYASGAQ